MVCLRAMGSGNDRLDRIERDLHEWIVESRDRSRRIDAQIQRMSAEVGKVSNGLGHFAEGIVAPSVEKLLRGQGFAITGFHPNAEERRGGDSMEVDFLALGQRAGNGTPVAVVVEVSSRLLVSDVSRCLEKLPDFFRFFTLYRDHELMGGVAGVQVGPAAARYAERKGLFVFGPGDELARLLNGPRFRPKVWRAGRNGR